MTVRSSTRGLPGLPRGRCGLSAFQASSDSQNKLFAMTIAPSDLNQAQIYNHNQLTVWVSNVGSKPNRASADDQLKGLPLCKDDAPHDPNA